MGAHRDPRNYLDVHLYNELRYLLCAATEWHVQHSVELGIDGHYAQVYALDSAALHARALFEFLTAPTIQNHFGLELYGLTPLKSDRYGSRKSASELGCWSKPLHSHLMHLQNRAAAQQLRSFDGLEMKDLNRMPVDFGREIVRLWREFIQRLQDPGNPGNPLASLAQARLNDAIAESALVVTHDVNQCHGISPIAW